MLSGSRVLPDPAGTKFRNVLSRYSGWQTWFPVGIVMGMEFEGATPAPTREQGWMVDWYPMVYILVQAFVIVGGFVVFAKLIAENIKKEIQADQKEDIHRIELAIETGKKDHESFRSDITLLQKQHTELTGILRQELASTNARLDSLYKK